VAQRLPSIQATRHFSAAVSALIARTQGLPHLLSELGKKPLYQFLIEPDAIHLHSFDARPDRRNDAVKFRSAKQSKRARDAKADHGRQSPSLSFVDPDNRNSLLTANRVVWRFGRKTVPAIR
jgi:hypothetical protein